MTERPYIDARFDRTARVWVATSPDVPGIVTEAPTLTKLCEKLEVMIPELMEARID